MSTSRQALAWFVGLVLLGLLLKLFSPILLPFVAGFAIAYFVDPAVERLGRAGLGRWMATSLVLGLFFLLFGLLVAFLLPLVQTQILDLASKAPKLFEAAQDKVAALVSQLSAQLSAEDMERLKGAAGSFAGDALKLLGGLLGRIWSGGLAFFNLLSLIFITPVVAFYILRDWPFIVKKLDSWLPRDHAQTIRRLIAEADEMISGFVRGMGIVCLVLAIFYGISLTIIGLDFSLLIGIGAGLISFIPFVGAIVGIVAAVGMALVQFSDWAPIAAVAGVFITGQVLEGNVLTPRLVGERIQLHPVWIIFALLAGGAVFGFVGILLSVPVAAVTGVLVRYATGRYVQSTLFIGTAQPQSQSEDQDQDEARDEDREETLGDDGW
jgi:predicted PurR-regulated permease PerM